MTKRKWQSVVSFLLVFAMALSFCCETYTGRAYAATSGNVTVRFHYNRTDSNYSDWFIWGWTENDTGAWYGFTETDSEGRGVATMSGVDGALTEVGFIVTTKSWTKDYDSDRTVDISDVSSGVVDVYLTQGNGSFTREVSQDAFVLSNARITGEKEMTIDWSLAQNEIPSLTVYDVTTGETRDDIVGSTPGDTSVIIQFANRLYLGHEYKITYSQSSTLSVKVNYDSESFEESYTYQGKDLGCTYTSRSTTFKVWAPTADKLSVLLFDKGTIEEGSQCVGEYEMEGGTIDTQGVWSKTLSGDYKNYYYVYKVEVAGNVDYCMDPYAVSGCTTNDKWTLYKSASTPKNSLMTGQRSMITDLDATDPAGWSTDGHVLTKKTSGSVYEVSIRDFSYDPDSGISEANRMKYLAFTETGTTLRGEGKLSTGIDYIKKLGVRYVQIMPSYDFAGTNEVTMENYNWGYNPVNYNIPEGCFATNPYDGNVRVNEYKQMVQSIHNQGMGVIMDVVYNHVNDAGSFCFNTLVPGYFVRPNSNGSGCGNDVASERSMVRKYIVDSVTYWANEYHIDGFRFDLVGLLDTQTMNEVRAALNQIDDRMLIYGEGWSLGTTTTKSVELATQSNTWKMGGVGMFSDVIRTDLRGGNDDSSTGFATGDLSKTTQLKDDILAKAWFTNDPTQMINYASCHDNYTLWDKIQKSTTWAWEESQVKMNKIVAAINLTSQGIPLFLSGEEFLRTKQGVENSYNSSDEINLMDWSLIEDNKSMVDYYAGLLEFRNNHDGLCMDKRADIDAAIQYINTGDCTLVYTIDGKTSGDIADRILIAFNPYLQERTVTLPDGEWKVCVNADNAGTDVLGVATGNYVMPGYSVIVLVQGETKKQDTIELSKPPIKEASNAADGILLKWGEVLNADGYRIYRDGVLIDTVTGQSQVQYKDQSANVAGKKYAYRVEAYAVLSSETVTCISGTKRVIRINQPVITSVANASSGILLKWKAMAEAGAYEIYRRTNGGSYECVGTVTGSTKNSFTDTRAVTNGAKYQYRIVATKTSSGVTYKSCQSSYVKIYRLTRPQFTTVVSGSVGKMTAKWNRNSKANGYEIIYDTDSAFKTAPLTITVADGKMTNKTITKLRSGRTYYVRMRTYVIVNGTKYYSTWSSTKSVKIL